MSRGLGWNRASGQGILVDRRYSVGRQTIGDTMLQPPGQLVAKGNPCVTKDVSNAPRYCQAAELKDVPGMWVAERAWIEGGVL